MPEGEEESPVFVTDYEYTLPPPPDTYDFRCESVAALTSMPYAAVRKQLGGLARKPSTVFRMLELLRETPANRNVRYDGATFEVYSCGQWRKRKARAGALDVLTNALCRFIDIDEMLEENMRGDSHELFMAFREEIDERLGKRVEDVDAEIAALVAKTLKYLGLPKWRDEAPRGPLPPEPDTDSPDAGTLNADTLT
jgi:hypothetical protein